MQRIKQKKKNDQEILFSFKNKNVPLKSTTNIFPLPTFRKKNKKTLPCNLILFK